KLPGDDVRDRDGILRGYAIQPLAEPAGFSSMSAEEQRLFGRGSYLVNAISSCNDCHTNPMRDFAYGPNYLDINTAQYLSGGGVYTVPPGLNAAIKQTRTMATNLTGEQNGISYSFATFLAKMVQGLHVDRPGAPPLGWPMPVQIYRNMTEEDLAAIYTYITRVPRRVNANDKETQPIARYCTATGDC